MSTVREEAHVITPAPELDLATAPQLGSQILESLANDQRRLIVDFRSVRMIDSAGIGVLLSAHRRVKAAGGQLIVANASEHVRHVFDLTGVGRSLELA